MAVGQHKLSRRALLGAVCASPALSVIPAEAGTSSDRARGRSSRGPGFRRDDGGWNEALARFHEAQAVLDAARSEPDEEAYDALLDLHSDALRALLALPVPDLGGLAAKLDVIVAHLAWELAERRTASNASAGMPTASPRHRAELPHAKDAKNAKVPGAHDRRLFGRIEPPRPPYGQIIIAIENFARPRYTETSAK